MAINTVSGSTPAHSSPSPSETQASPPTRESKSLPSNEALGALAKRETQPKTVSVGPRGSVPNAEVSGNKYSRLPSTFTVHSDLVHQEGTQKPPRENSGEPYSTASHRDDSGHVSKVYGFVDTKSGHFVVTNPKNHEPVAVKNFSGTGEDMKLHDGGLSGGGKSGNPLKRSQLKSTDHVDEKTGDVRNKHGQYVGTLESRSSRSPDSDGSRTSKKSVTSSKSGASLSSRHRNELASGSASKHSISEAHASYQKQNYEPIGYHGTNGENAEDMISRGLSTAHIGSSAGTARGPGFYVAGVKPLAEDYAHEASHTYETRETKYGPVDEEVRKPGKAGQPAVLTAYGQPTVSRGRSIYGVQSADGDPNGDRMPKHVDTSSSGLASNRHDMERVIPARHYKETRVLPSLPNSGPIRVSNSSYEAGDKPYAPETGRKRSSHK